MYGNKNCICKKLGIKVCGKCRLKRYCSAECQTNDWNDHKKDCLNHKYFKELDKELKIKYEKNTKMKYGKNQFCHTINIAIKHHIINLVFWQLEKPQTSYNKKNMMKFHIVSTNLKHIHNEITKQLNEKIIKKIYDRTDDMIKQIKCCRDQKKPIIRDVYENMFSDCSNEIFDSTSLHCINCNKIGESIVTVIINTDNLMHICKHCYNFTYNQNDKLKQL